MSSSFSVNETLPNRGKPSVVTEKNPTNVGLFSNETFLGKVTSTDGFSLSAVDFEAVAAAFFALMLAMFISSLCFA